MGKKRYEAPKYDVVVFDSRNILCATKSSMHQWCVEGKTFVIDPSYEEFCKENEINALLWHDF